MILYFFKQLYYLKLVEYFASDIDIIFLIFDKIKRFTIIMAGSIVAFAVSFFILGKNQIQFDHVAYSEAPGYVSFGQAVMYIQQVIMTGGEIDGFEVGKDPTNYYFLLLLYVLGTFYLVIHMLNMLVAIMGEAFSIHREKSDILMQRERLGFIIDKWFFKEMILYKSMIQYVIDLLNKNILKFDQMNYIVVAFLDEELGAHGD